MPDQTPPVTPDQTPPAYVNNAQPATDVFGNGWWKTTLWVIGGIVLAAGVALVLWLAFRTSGASTGGGSILPIATFVMLMAIGAIIALVVSFLVNRRSISASKVIGVVGGILAIMFVFALIAYNFPGFGQAMGFSALTPAANTTANAANSNVPPLPPAKQIEKTVWDRKEVFKLGHLNPHMSVADFKPPHNARNCQWEATGYWCAGNIGTTTGCSGNWHGLPEEKRSGECSPNPDELYPISTGSFTVDNLVITMEIPRVEIIDNPDYFAHCAKYNNCAAETPANS